MKCTKCGKEHAIYHYVTNINGDRNETHLCEECAAKLKAEGGEYPWDSFNKLMNDSFDSFFANDPWMSAMLPRSFMSRRPRSLMDSFFGDDFFSMPTMGAMMMPAFFFPTERAPQKQAEEKVKTVEEAEAQPKAEETAEVKAETGTERPKAHARRVDEELSRRREINALRAKMHRAARSEDYETAAKLRDELRRLEGGAQA